MKILSYVRDLRDKTSRHEIISAAIQGQIIPPPPPPPPPQTN